MADWLAIKNEYLATGASFSQLAKKHGINKSTISRKANKDGWENDAATIRNEAQQKVAKAIEQREVDRVKRLLDMSDRLSDKVDKAIDELETYVTKTKSRKRVKRNKRGEDGQYTEAETIDENEDVKFVKGIVDRQGIRQIAAALKDLKEIQTELGGAKDEYESDGFLESIYAVAGDLGDDDSYMLNDGDEQ